jgi:hypothetical protein
MADKVLAVGRFVGLRGIVLVLLLIGCAPNTTAACRPDCI